MAIFYVCILCHFIPQLEQEQENSPIIIVSTDKSTFIRYFYFIQRGQFVGARPLISGLTLAKTLAKIRLETLNFLTCADSRKKKNL